MRFGVFTALAACFVAAGRGCGDGQVCDTNDFAATSGEVLRVSATCGVSGGDGSLQMPFATIGAAAKAAKPGQTISIGRGRYVEELSVPAGIVLVGHGATTTIIAPPAGMRGIVAEAAGKEVEIRSLAVEGATKVGVGTSGPAMALTNVHIIGTKVETGNANSGHGVAAVNADGLRLEGCKITGNAGIGIGAWGSGQVAIIDPHFDGGARASDGKSIIDPHFSPASSIASNAAGGVAIIDPHFDGGGKNDKPDPSAAALVIRATDLASNGKYGIAVYGGNAVLERVAVRDSKADKDGAADGVVVAAGADKSRKLAVSLDAASVVTGNDRAGLLMATKGAVDVGALVSANRNGGVWAQGDKALVRLDAKARLAGNSLVGVAATAGAALEANSARIEGTKKRKFQHVRGGDPVDIGDGVGVFAGGRATLKGCRLSGNARAAVIGHQTGVAGDGAVAVSISGSTFAGSELGIVINKGGKGTVPAAAWQASNTFEASVKTKVESAGDLPVQVSPCGDGKGAAACAP